MKKLRIGMIGAGGRGGWFVRNKFMATRYSEYTESKDFEMVAVSEPSDTWMEKAFPDGLGDVRRVKDWKKMIKADDLDVIVIMTPDHMHEEMAVASFRAGKHVFCEKPLALTPKACRMVIDAGKKAGKKLIVGFVLRYAPAYMKMKTLIDSGAVGDVCGVWMLHSVGGSDYYFHDWHAVEKNTNSLLLQKGSHDLDIINWIVGSKPKRVAAFAGLQYFGGKRSNSLTCPECPDRKTCPEVMNGPRVECAFRKEVDVNDNHVVIVDYANGVKASYNECHFTPDDNREYTFIGTRGKLYMNGAENWIRVQERHKKGAPIKEYRTTALGGHGGGDDRLLEDLVKCIRGKGEPVAGGEAGYLSVLVADGAARSIREGRVIDL